MWLLFLYVLGILGFGAFPINPMIHSKVFVALLAARPWTTGLVGCPNPSRQDIKSYTSNTWELLRPMYYARLLSTGTCPQPGEPESQGALLLHINHINTSIPHCNAKAQDKGNSRNHDLQDPFVYIVGSFSA